MESQGKRIMVNSCWAKKNLNTLAKSFYNYNAICQNSYTNKNIAIKTIIAKQRKEIVDYIYNYNLSKK